MVTENCNIGGFLTSLRSLTMNEELEQLWIKLSLTEEKQNVVLVE